MANTQQLTFLGFVLRFLFALLLVLATYNPSGYSFTHWLLMSFQPLNITPYLAIAGLLLIIGWAIFLRATFRSLGKVGVILASAFFACIIWLFFYWGWLSFTNVSVLTWLVLGILALILALGMSWSHIRRRLSGQVDTDDIDN